MELITFFQVVVRRGWLLVLLGLTGLVVAAAVSLSLPRRYQSTVTLQLNPAGQSAFLPYTWESSPIATLAASYREVLRSRAFGELVVERLRLPVAPEAIGNAIKADLVPNTNILRLTVQWEHPQDAQQLAQSIAEIFITENLRRQQLQGGSQARLAEMEESARNFQTRIETLRRQRDRIDQGVSRGDLTRLSELNELESRLTALETSYADLLVEINRARGTLNTAAILDNATEPVPAGDLPLSRALVFGLLAGLAAGVALSYFLESVDDRVRAPEDVVGVDGRAPLGVLGHVLSGPPGREAGSPLVVRDAPRTPVAETFRTLRTNLRFATLDHPARRLVVTSPDAREGKTLVASNLAIALAQAGHRVLLVDADLRHPSVHTLFGAPSTPGLVDALLENGGADRGAQAAGETPGVLPSGVDGLWLLPAGNPPPNPGEVLGSAATARLLERLSAAWDFVVLDTAPLGPVADTLPLAAHADGALLIARAGQTRRGALRRALEALQQTGRPVVGVALNDFRPGPLSRYGPYGYYHSYYYASSYYASANGREATEAEGAARGDHSSGRRAGPGPRRGRREERR